MTEDIFKKLSHNIGMAGFSIDSIEQLVNFSKTCADDGAGTLLKLKAKNISSLVYASNHYPSKSFEIDLQLLAQFPVHLPEYGNLLLRSIKTSSHLGEMAKVSPFVLLFLQKSLSNFYTTIPLLAWYAGFDPILQEEAIIRSAVTTAALEIGMEIDPSLSLTQQIRLLNSEFVRACKDLDTFILAYIDADEQAKELLIEKYLAKEPLLFYRNAASRYHK